jgi:hypothetical protein
MLWPLLKLLHGLFGVAVGQRFDKVCVLGRTKWTRNWMAVITEEVQSLMWM